MLRGSLFTRPNPISSTSAPMSAASTDGTRQPQAGNSLSVGRIAARSICTAAKASRSIRPIRTSSMRRWASTIICGQATFTNRRIGAKPGPPPALTRTEPRSAWPRTAETEPRGNGWQSIRTTAPSSFSDRGTTVCSAAGKGRRPAVGPGLRDCRSPAARPTASRSSCSIRLRVRRVKAAPLFMRACTIRAFTAARITATPGRC